MSSRQQPSQDTANDSGIAPPPKRYRCKLDSAQDVRREMSRVYRECRSYLVDVQDGSKLIFMLSQLLKAIETGDIEARLEALEALKK